MQEQIILLRFGVSSHLPRLAKNGALKEWLNQRTASSKNGSLKERQPQCGAAELRTGKSRGKPLKSGSFYPAASPDDA